MFGLAEFAKKETKTNNYFPPTPVERGEKEFLGHFFFFGGVLILGEFFFLGGGPKTILWGGGQFKIFFSKIPFFPINFVFLKTPFLGPVCFCGGPSKKFFPPPKRPTLGAPFFFGGFFFSWFF